MQKQKSRASQITSELGGESYQSALQAVYVAMAEDTHLIGLMGAVVYAGNLCSTPTPTGEHFFVQAPTLESAIALRNRAVDLFHNLSTSFNVNRLLISTAKDPFHFVPADDWQSDGFKKLPDGGYIGLGTVDGHPSWYAVVRLDDRGNVVR